jgi:hypothetical protein
MASVSPVGISGSGPDVSRVRVRRAPSNVIPYDITGLARFFGLLYIPILDKIDIQQGLNSLNNDVFVWNSISAS